MRDYDSYSLPLRLKIALGVVVVYVLFIFQVVLFAGPTKAQRAACATECAGQGKPHVSRVWPLWFKKQAACTCHSETAPVYMDGAGNVQ